MKKKYQLKDVIISIPESNETAEILSSLGKATARYLDKKVKDNDVIGVSWGKTLVSVARQLIPNDRKNVQVVYLKGTVANSTHNNYVVEVTKCFNKCYHTQAQILPLPLIFENKQIKEMVIKDKFINEILDTGKRTSVALFTVETTEQDATLFELGYFNDQQIKTLQEKAAGGLVSRFIDERGKIVDDQLNDRTVAIALDDLKQARESVLIAGGMNKLKAIKAALAGKYANVLVTDSLVAQHLL
ncbi:sugar-binding transcriptional regulator [Limosilactobacillus reuteri]|uniref:sugar-binding transcriptional regulator n=1 Tax=Limosilactobacillus TaxID=2742598 RepID=UPI002D1FA89C|nr:sugar-binding domain-containing protein [Limosilactobacillus reuteri]MCC4490963.1 sugar-binding transcriptional regulator [Limosilactobacillus reuteri]